MKTYLKKGVYDKGHAVPQGAIEINAKPYKSYVALLSQGGTDAPTAVVLENTLGGEIVWTRDGAGTYTGTLTGAFPASKTVILTGSSGILLTAGWNSVNEVYLFTDAMPTAARGDNLLLEQSIEIRVYA